MASRVIRRILIQRQGKAAKAEGQHIAKSSKDRRMTTDRLRMTRQDSAARIKAVSISHPDSVYGTAMEELQAERRRTLEEVLEAIDKLWPNRNATIWRGAMMSILADAMLADEPAGREERAGVCPECGALVVTPHDHREWHDQQHRLHQSGGLNA